MSRPGDGLGRRHVHVNSDGQNGKEAVRAFGSCIDTRQVSARTGHRGKRASTADGSAMSWTMVGGRGSVRLVKTDIVRLD